MLYKMANNNSISGGLILLTPTVYCSSELCQEYSSEDLKILHNSNVVYYTGCIKKW